MRNPNGYGATYRLNGRRRRPWVARITTGWTPDGKQQRQIIGYFETRQEAMDALAMNRKEPISPKANITLGDLYKEWSSSKYEYISKDTINNYKAAWKYLSKYENIKVKDIRTAQLQDIITECYKNKKSQSTLTKIKALATSLYSYAIANDIVNKNYATLIEMPSFDKNEKDIFTDLEIQKMLDNVDKIEWVDTILIMIYTGMRITEMLTLTKFNIDLEKQLITGGIKTDAGKNRIIPIHPKIFKYIEARYKQNGETIICKKNGKKMSADYYRKYIYYPTLEKLEIRKLNPHCCRHTFATLLSNAGAETVFIQKLIGHSDYATTANIYTHTDIEELRKNINLI
jgi:site-specific recombinase XerD